jgi:hypothetical protein
MAMSQSILAAELDVEIQNTETLAEAINAWAAAWKTYFTDAESNSVPILTPILDTAEAAMAVAMPSLGVDAGAALTSGVTAWWATLVASPPLTFTACTAITPPAGLAGIAAALTPVFISNRDGELSKADALNAIASALHPLNLGGTATFPGPIVAPIL